MRGKKNFRLDLHIHTCLSPCADLLMTPANIIRAALQAGLDCIAITDHNTGGNVEVAMKIARGSGLQIIPAMEIETREEVHLLCLFPVLEALLEWDKLVAENLPDLKNDEEFFGYQLYTDDQDEYIAKEERLLAVASRLSFNEVVEGVVKLGGMIIPAHVDRPANGIIRQLGFIPPEAEISIVEISRHAKVEEIRQEYPYLKNYPYLTGSDSHYLSDIGNCGQEEKGFPLTENLLQVLAEYLSL